MSVSEIWADQGPAACQGQLVTQSRRPDKAIDLLTEKLLGLDSAQEGYQRGP
jgi:hypothetical protein